MKTLRLLALAAVFVGIGAGKAVATIPYCQWACGAYTWSVPTGTQPCADWGAGNSIRLDLTTNCNNPGSCFVSCSNPVSVEFTLYSYHCVQGIPIRDDVVTTCAPCVEFSPPTTGCGNSRDLWFCWVCMENPYSGRYWLEAKVRNGACSDESATTMCILSRIVYWSSFDVAWSLASDPCP